MYYIIIVSEMSGHYIACGTSVKQVVNDFSVQKGIIALFQGKSPEDSLISLNSKVKSLIKLDIGEFVVPFYEVSWLALTYNLALFSSEL